MSAVERWLPVVGYEGAYEVSDLGRVRSLDRVTDRGRQWKGRVMAPVVMRNGYQIATLWRAGAQSTHLVHRLVLDAFVGPAPEKAEACHGNGIRSDNRLRNLSWGTHSENQFDQVAHGTHRNASATRCRHGHPYDEVNTYFYPNRRKRACRACRTRYMSEHVAKKRQNQGVA